MTGVPDNEDRSNPWHELLEDASRKASMLPEETTMILLGDNGSGKASLVSALGGKEDDDKGKNVGDNLALAFNHMNVYGEDENDILSRVHIWQLGDDNHADLLKFALKKETYPRTIAMITLDMAKPWSLLQELRKWLSILDRECQKVTKTMPVGAVDELKQKIEKQWTSYKAPAEGSSTDGDSAALLGLSVPVVKETGEVEAEADVEDIPLPQGALTHNLGIPIIVALLKCDLLSENAISQTQVQEYELKDGHYEFIQQRLRLECLGYGASLFYVSSMADINVSSLGSYINHRLYGMNNGVSVVPQVLDRERVVVPAGWDTLAKIEVIFDGPRLAPNGLDTPYEDVIVDNRSKRIQVGGQEAETIVAEDDQAFLQKQLSGVQRIEAERVLGRVTRAAETQAATPTGIATPTSTAPASASASKIMAMTPNAATASPAAPNSAVSSIERSREINSLLAGTREASERAAAAEAEARLALAQLEANRAARHSLGPNNPKPTTPHLHGEGQSQVHTPAPNQRKDGKGSGKGETTATGTPVQPIVLENFFQSLMTRDGPSGDDARRKAEAELSRLTGSGK